MPTVCARTAHTWLFEAMTPSLVTSEFLLPASAFRHQSATDAGNCGSIPFDSFFFPLVPPDSLRLAEAGLSETACILLSLPTPASRACQASGTEGWARISEGERSSGRSRGVSISHAQSSSARGHGRLVPRQGLLSHFCRVESQGCFCSRKMLHKRQEPRGTAGRGESCKHRQKAILLDDVLCPPQEVPRTHLRDGSEAPPRKADSGSVM